MSIFDKGKIKFIAKGTILLQQGEVCHFACKVVKGCLKSFVIDRSGKEHIIQFAPEGWIVTDMESLINNTPSYMSIEASEDSEVIWIDSNKTNVWENTTRDELLEQIKLFTRNIAAANKRIRMLLSCTAEERYLDFLDTYPTLTERLTLKLIASYIGVTPEYVSEIRRKIARK
jgi:CRP-like cAMP-binding protein